MKIEPGRLYMIRTNTTLRIIRTIDERSHEGEHSWYCECIWPVVNPVHTFNRYVYPDQLEPLELLLLARNFKELGNILNNMATPEENDGPT